MNLREFHAAFGALHCGVTGFTSGRKPKSLLSAAGCLPTRMQGYARGTLARREDMEVLSKLTMVELFELRWQLGSKEKS